MISTPALRSRPQPASRQPAGYSLTEMIITITVIGILAGIAILSISGTNLASREVIAREKLEMLNRGIHTHQQTNGVDNLENLLPVPGATWDEQKILLQLQYRHPTEPTLGSPYVPTNYRPPVSASSDDFRQTWTGTVFKLLKPGEIGSGLKVPFDGSDFGTPIVFPPTYKWSGR